MKIEQFKEHFAKQVSDFREFRSDKSPGTVSRSIQYYTFENGDAVDVALIASGYIGSHTAVYHISVGEERIREIVRQALHSYDFAVKNITYIPSGWSFGRMCDQVRV